MRGEQFLRGLGSSPAESTSRNPLEQPLELNEEDFTRRARRYPNPSTTLRTSPDLHLFHSVRGETIILTEEIGKVEGEIDARVRSLYGVG